MDKLSRKIIRKMILQEAVMLKRERVHAARNLKIADFCARKESKMISEGYSRLEINESIFKSIIKIDSINESMFADAMGFLKKTVGGAGGGFFDTIQQMVIEKVLKKIFGVDYDPDSFLGAVISNVIENIDIMEIGKYFGEGACDPIVDTLYDGISEAVVQKGLSKIFGDRSEAGMITSTMREAFTNAINTIEFQETMKSGLKSVVCNLDFASIKDTITSGMSNVGDKAKSFAGTAADSLGKFSTADAK